MKRAVFLDRDGVINKMWLDPEHGTVDSPANPEQFQFLPDVPKAIAKLKKMGFQVVVVSNQPGIAKGKLVSRLLDEITRKMEDGLAEEGVFLDKICYCLHHPEAVLPEYREVCECRKPKPGLLIQAARELEIDLAASYMVGDGLTDVQAGKAAGCVTIWLGNMRCDVCNIMDEDGVKPDYVASSLYEAVELIREKENSLGNFC